MVVFSEGKQVKIEARDVAVLPVAEVRAQVAVVVGFVGGYIGRSLKKIRPACSPSDMRSALAWEPWAALARAAGGLGASLSGKMQVCGDPNLRASGGVFG